MTFQLKTDARFFDLHCCVGLTDWDMDKELKLATTTDQIHHDDKPNDQYVAQRPSARASRRKDEFIWYDKTSDTFVKPNPWLWVNPNIVCPIEYIQNDADQQPEPAHQLPEKQDPPICPHQEDLLPSPPPSAEYTIKKEEGRSGPTRTRRKGRVTKVVDLKTLKPGCWPRPPVNYCILISLALKSSQTGSLKVQQIYNFTSSFRKTCNQLCKEGKRKSCFWHLTLDGHRRLQDEIQVLTSETLKMLKRSMSKPDVVWSLLEM
ncbi:forkhead box protein R1 isoform X2 [Fundulus heteroclitus]|uniref:forkhead box protein R1 isoform X2 n=1 Tax=Fundulus heteroclitus TaxID=8078 RepID=UPI00165B3617|nr:forkhead box protein R1 isoform X2 [Fundulus heteroclitus]